jgi:hypothetical protein
MVDVINFQVRELKANFKLVIIVAVIIISIGLVIYLIWPKAEKGAESGIPEEGKTLEEIEETLRQMASQNESPLTVEEETEIKEDLKQMTSALKELSEEERQQSEENLRQMMSQ